MSATVPRRTRPPGDLAQTGVVALLLAVAAMTWALTHRRMAGMDAGPGSDLAGRMRRPDTAPPSREHWTTDSPSPAERRRMY